MEKKFALVSHDGWIGEWRSFMSRGKECFSYMTSWNERDRQYFSREEARRIQKLFREPVAIREFA